MNRLRGLPEKSSDLQRGVRGCWPRVVRGSSGRSGGSGGPGSTGPAPRSAAGGEAFDLPPPPVYFPGVPGRFPRGLFTWKMRRQRQAKIYFYGRSLWGRPRTSFPCTTPPSSSGATNPEMPSPRAGAGASPLPRHPGKGHGKKLSPL